MEHDSVKDFFLHVSKKYSDKPMVTFRSNYRRFTYSYQEIERLTKQTANFLLKNGLKKGDKVVVYSYNSPEWICVYFACSLIGVIIVPIDFNSNTTFVKDITRKVGAKKVFSSLYKQTKSKQEIILEELFDRITQEPATYKEIDIHKNDLLEIVYTSGTTSQPKGVMITHHNVVSNVHNLRSAFSMREGTKLLSILPLSHMLEQTVGLIAPMSFGAHIIQISSRKSSLIKEALTEEKVETVVSVPAFLKSLKDSIEREIDRRNKKKQFKKIILRINSFPSPIKNFLLRRIVKKMGLYLDFLVVGGSKLDEDVELFWRSLGVPVLQGYGLTETSPIITSSTFDYNKVGSVGRVLPNQELSVSEDGEIKTRGAHVCAGYYQNKKETETLIKDEWLYTGDIGAIDEEGFLTIKGRKKNVIITDSGLNIYPEDIEVVLKQQPSIKDAVVVLYNNLITGVVLLDNKKMRVDVKELLSVVNSEVQDFQKVQELVVWEQEDFPRTPTLKVKRNELLEILANTLSGDKKVGSLHNADELSKILLRVSPNIHFTNESKLVSDLKVDSLKRLELLSLIEEEFQQEIAEEAITEETTVADLKKLLSQEAKNSANNCFNKWYLLRSATFIRLCLQTIIFPFLRFFMSLRVEGKENLPSNSETIFVINHTSHLDSIVFLRALPFGLRRRVALAAAADYFFENKAQSFIKDFRIFFLSCLLNIYPFYRETNTKVSFKNSGKVIDSGFSIGIFPEGTRTTSGKIGSFKTGIGYLVSEMRVPVIPVRIEGLFSVLPKGKSVPKRGPVKVIFGKPIHFMKTESYISIAQRLEDEVKKL